MLGPREMIRGPVVSKKFCLEWAKRDRLSHNLLQKKMVDQENAGHSDGRPNSAITPYTSNRFGRP